MMMMQRRRTAKALSVTHSLWFSLDINTPFNTFNDIYQSFVIIFNIVFSEEKKKNYFFYRKKLFYSNFVALWLSMILASSRWNFFFLWPSVIHYRWCARDTVRVVFGQYLKQIIKIWFLLIFWSILSWQLCIEIDQSSKQFFKS